MKLINARPSPFGRKVAIALREKGLPFETVWDAPWRETTVVANYNPLAQLPILIADDGEIAYESTYLLEWLERRYPEPPLLPVDTNGVLLAKKLMVLAEGVMNAAASVAIDLRRPDQSRDWLRRQRSKIVAASEALASHVERRAYACCDAFGQADIAIAVNLTMLDFLTDAWGLEIELHRWRQRLPTLAAYVDCLEQRPSFKATYPEDFDFAPETKPD